MATDIDSLYSLVADLDETQLQREVDDLRAQQDRIMVELTKRLDLLDLKGRWEQRQAGNVPQRPLGVGNDITERLRQQPVPQPPPGNDKPVGTEAIRRLLADGSVWTIPNLHRELETRGWVTGEAQHPEKSTETSVHRMYKRGEVIRVGRGKYAIKPTALTDFQAETVQAVLDNVGGG